MDQEADKIEEIAQEMANKYRQKMYGLGSSKKYSIDYLLTELENAKEKLSEPNKNKMVERFYQLVGLDGDRSKAHHKLLRDFPG